MVSQDEYPELKARLGRFIYSSERMTLKRTLKLFGKEGEKVRKTTAEEFSHMRAAVKRGEQDHGAPSSGRGGGELTEADAAEIWRSAAGQKVSLELKHLAKRSRQRVSNGLSNGDWEPSTAMTLNLKGMLKNARGRLAIQAAAVAGYGGGQQQQQQQQVSPQLEQGKAVGLLPSVAVAEVASTAAASASTDTKPHGDSVADGGNALLPQAASAAAANGGNANSGGSGGSNSSNSVSAVADLHGQLKEMEQGMNQRMDRLERMLERALGGNCQACMGARACAGLHR